MQFANEFTVRAPAEQVFAAFADLERVVPCVPGAELEGAGEDGARLVGLKVKVGPISMRYRGQVALAEQDAAARRLRLRARVRDVRGQGSTQAVVAVAVADAPEGTQVALDSDVAVTGKIAQLGQGAMQEVAAGLIDRFAANLEAMLAAQGATAPGAAAAAANGAAAAAPAGAGADAGAGDAGAGAGAAPPLPSAPADAGGLGLALVAPLARRVALPALAGALAALLVATLLRARGGGR